MSLVDLGIVVALSLEHEAALGIMESKEEVHYPGPLDYTRGVIEGYRSVLIQAFEPGSVYSALATSDLIRDFKHSPREYEEVFQFG